MSERERLALTFALGLVMERQGAGRVEFSARELRWGLSGRQVNTFLSVDGDFAVWLTDLPEMVPGGAAVCPWPAERNC